MSTEDVRGVGDGLHIKSDEATLSDIWFGFAKQHRMDRKDDMLHTVDRIDIFTRSNNIYNTFSKDSPRTFLTCFFIKRLILVPIDMPESDFEFC